LELPVPGQAAMQVEGLDLLLCKHGLPVGSSAFRSLPTLEYFRGKCCGTECSIGRGAAICGGRIRSMEGRNLGVTHTQTYQNSWYSFVQGPLHSGPSLYGIRPSSQN
jgi:hypothetical protein